MAETIYAHQVTNISIQGGIVRLELAVIDELPNGQGDTIKMRISHQLVLPLDAFVKAFEIQQTVMSKLVQDGVLRRMERPAGASPTEPVQPGNP